MIILVIPHFSNLNQLPIGMHGWAQSDRYAIALNFLEEDNLLKPKTNALYTEDGKVGVEFSGLAYVSAKIATFFNVKSSLPLIFKSLNMLLLALLLTYFITSIYEYHITNSLINIILWITSPLILFYGFNFIPDSLGLGFALCSLGFYYQYHKGGKNSLLLMALIMGSLGGLTKLPILIYPIAIIAHQVYLLKKAKKLQNNTLWNLILGAIGIAGVLAYDYVFLIEMNNKLWSVIFMGQPNPIKSTGDLVEALNGVLYWRYELFNPIQWVAIVLILLFVIIRIKTISLFYIEFGLVLLLGLFFYFFGLGKQLIHHDYYFLSSFMPFVIFVATLLTKRLLKAPQILFKVVLLLITTLISFDNFNQAKARKSEYYTIRKNTLDNNLSWLYNGAKKLDQVGVEKEAIIFVLYDFAPNTSLVYFNRKGLVFNHEQMSRKEPHIEVWLEKLNPGYIIVKSDWEKDFIRDKSEIAKTWIRNPQDGFILFKKP